MAGDGKMRIGPPKDHETVSELAEELRVNRRSIHRLLKKQGLVFTKAWVTTEGGRQECIMVPPESASFVRQWFRRDA
jgi:hypothetical protein